MSSEANVKDIIDSNKDYSDLEKEFLLYYWDSLKKDYLSSLTYNNVWVPHIGLFKLKYNKLIFQAKKLLSTLKKYRKQSKNNSLNISPEKHEAIREEFRLLWNHIQDYKKQFYLDRQNNNKTK